MTGLKLFLRRILPQLVTLALVVGLISIMFPGFFDISIANGRLYGSPIDILNRGAPVALLAIGMTLVIATGGIDLSVGAVMAICGAMAAWGITEGYGLGLTLMMALAAGLACGLWNGLLVAVLGIQPIVATLILMVAGRGIAQLITEGAILTFNHEGLIFLWLRIAVHDPHADHHRDCDRGTGDTDCSSFGARHVDRGDRHQSSRQHAGWRQYARAADCRIYGVGIVRGAGRGDRSGRYPRSGCQQCRALA